MRQKNEAVRPRRGLRYDAAHGTTVTLVRDGRPEPLGLVINESHTGFSAVFTAAHLGVINAGDVVVANVGRLGPVRCEIRWVRWLSDDLARIGCMYLT